MAKAPAPAEAEAETPPKKKSKKLLVIVLIIVLVVVLVGVGVVALLKMKRGSSSDADGEVSSAAPASTLVDLSRPPTFVSLDPFVVNLSPEEGDRYLQVVMALRVPDAKTGDNLKGFMPEIRHRINLLLASKLPSEVATLQGREDLAAQIGEEINKVLGAPPAAPGQSTGPIQAVLFNSFIVQ